MQETSFTPTMTPGGTQKTKRAPRTKTAARFYSKTAASAARSEEQATPANINLTTAPTHPPPR